jgi:hypothetical protein
MSEHKRIRAMALLVQDRGMSEEAGELIARALFPLDTSPGGLPVSRRFPKKIARRSERFRKAAQSTPLNVIVDLAYEAIGDYRDLAAAAGEDYYVAIFEEMTADPAPWAGELGPDTDPDSMVAQDER